MSANFALSKPHFSHLKNDPIPRSENDLKLQALLIYVDDRLKNLISSLKDKSLKRVFQSEEDEMTVYMFNKELKKDIEKHVPSFDSIEQQMLKILNKKKKTYLDVMTFNEYTPMSKYYNIIVQEFEKDFKKETLWIPDLVAIALMNFWMKDKGKTTLTYDFVFKYNFQEILDIYNRASLKKKIVTYIKLLIACMKLQNK